MEKHTLKFYRYNDLICDMRSSRKQFFPIMCGDDHIADLEKADDEISNIVGLDLRFTFRQGLEPHLYNDLYELMSLISKHNEVKWISVALLEHMRDSDKTDKTPYPTKFPPFRRKKQENGRLIHHYNKKRYFPNEIQKLTIGRFFIISHNGNKMLINKDTYNKLRELDNQNTYSKINCINDSVFPRLIKENETIEDCGGYLNYIVDDIKDLDNVTLELHDSASGDDIEQYVFINIFVPGEDLNKTPLSFPYIYCCDDDNTVPTSYVTQFINRDTGNLVKFDKDMIDLKNAENYNIHINEQGGITLKEKTYAELHHNMNMI